MLKILCAFVKNNSSFPHFIVWRVPFPGSLLFCVAEMLRFIMQTGNYLDRDCAHLNGNLISDVYPVECAFFVVVNAIELRLVI